MKLCPCNNPVFSKGLCLRCWKKKYGKPLNKTSKKKQKANTDYVKERKAWLPLHPYCEAKLNGCTLLATEVHHKQGRTGELLLNTDKWLAVCHSCHEKITECSQEAIQLGLSLKRNV